MFVSAKRLPYEFANVYVDEEWIFLTTKLELTRGFMFGKRQEEVWCCDWLEPFYTGPEVAAGPERPINIPLSRPKGHAHAMLGVSASIN